MKGHRVCSDRPTGYPGSSDASWKVSKIDTPQMMIKSYSAEEDEKLFVKIKLQYFLFI